MLSRPCQSVFSAIVEGNTHFSLLMTQRLQREHPGSQVFQYLHKHVGRLLLLHSQLEDLGASALLLSRVASLIFWGDVLQSAQSKPRQTYFTPLEFLLHHLPVLERSKLLCMITVACNNLIDYFLRTCEL